MAITRAQQVKQMLREGGRIGLKGGADASTFDSPGRQVSVSPSGDVRTTNVSPGGGNSRRDSGPDDRSTELQTINQLRNQNRFVAEDEDLLPGDTPIEGVDIPLTTRERVQNENKDLFINKPANYGKYVPPAAQFLANFNREPNRRFFYERVLKNNAQGLNYTELEEEYEKYMAGRMSGETDAMGRTIISSGRDDDPIIFPIQQSGIMTQDTGIMDQETDEEEEEPFERAIRFRADGGPIGGIMDLESGRQMYFLGKLVKKATRAVKKIAKSPIGKAALIGAAAFGIPGTSIGGLFGRASFMVPAGGAPGIFGFGGIGNAAIAAKAKLFGSALPPTQGLGKTKGLLDFIGGKAGATIIGTSLLAGALTPAQEQEAQLLADNTGIDIEEARNQILRAAKGQDDFRARAFKADGGIMRAGYQEGSKEPVAKKTMPLLDMGGKEMDLREDGGFVPIGRMEKADDVPARLSKNEFVFTADAVRNAGDGDVDKGAEVMYNMMKNLEAGGDVSEESQGLEGARRMFQTSQRLEEVL